MSKTVDECIVELSALKKMPPTDITMLYKKVKQLSGGKSGALVFIIQKDKKRYLLKYYNQTNYRPLREVISLCRLSSVEGFPNLIKKGFTVAPKSWSPDTKFHKDRGLYVIMDIVPGVELSKVNIKMGKKNALNVSLSILHRLIQARNALGKDFEHYDLHPNNIFIDKSKCLSKTLTVNSNNFKVECPAVYIIDFDLVTAESIKCIPMDKEHHNKKEGYLGILSTVVPAATWSFLKKWSDSVLDTMETIYGVSNVSNTDIRNWLVISSIIFEENGINDSLTVCKDAEDCVKKNKNIFMNLIKK